MPCLGKILEKALGELEPGTEAHRAVSAIRRASREASEEAAKVWWENKMRYEALPWWERW